MKNLYYYYEVRILESAEILNHNSIKEKFPNIGKIRFLSENFDTPEQCEEKMNALFINLITAENSISVKNLTTVQRLSPILDKDSEETLKFEPWDQFTLERIYAVDEDEMKKGQLSYMIYGQIKCSNEILGFKKDS